MVGPGQPPETVIDVPPLDEIVDNPAKLTTQLQLLSGQVTELNKLNDIITSSGASPNLQSQQKINNYRERFLDQWSVSFPSALQIFKHEMTREEGYQQLTGLRDHLLKVHQLTKIPSNESLNNKERQCLELLQTLRFDPRFPVVFRESLSPSP